jgi:hypothetical protein
MLHTHHLKNTLTTRTNREAWQTSGSIGQKDLLICVQSLKGKDAFGISRLLNVESRTRRK